MTAPQEVTAAATQADPEAVTVGMGRAIEGRSLGQIAWRRLRRDKVALGGGIVIIALILVAILAPVIVALVGHDPLEFHYDQVDPDLQVSSGFFGGVSPQFPFGVEPVNGRDIFSRVVYGARISLLIAFFATLLAVLVGTVFGIVAGYFGGWVDTLISRTMDVFLAFPILLFALALVGIIPEQAFGLQGDTLRIVLIVAIIGLSELALHRTDHPRADAVAARARVRRRRPQPRRPHPADPVLRDAAQPRRADPGLLRRC